jgi:hypothetical protein
VNISPLGVTRRVTPKPPRAWRIIPLLAGLAEFGFFVVHGRPATVTGQVHAYLTGFLLVMIGLITAGPWLTMTGALPLPQPIVTCVPVGASDRKAASSPPRNAPTSSTRSSAGSSVR